MIIIIALTKSKPAILYISYVIIYKKFSFFDHLITICINL